MPALFPFTERNAASARKRWEMKGTEAINMEWFNVFGLLFIAVVMIPNIIFAIKCKDGFLNKWENKYVEVI